MNEPIAPPAPARGGRRDWDAYAAVVASLIGLLALSVSGYTAYLQRQQVRAQVWPYVTLSRWDGHRFVAHSLGMGPAKVTAVRVAVDGRPMASWSELFKAIGQDGQDAVTATLSGRVLPPNERIDWLALPSDEDGRKVFSAILAQDKFKVGMMICYCSVLGDCWWKHMGSREAMPVPERDDDEPTDCPIRENDRFRD